MEMGTSGTQRRTILSRGDRVAGCLAVVGSLALAPGSATPQTVNLGALPTTHPGFIVAGIAANDESGRVVSGGGDVNGDGLDDIVIGAARADAGTPARVDAGEVYVVFGRTATVPAIDLTALDAEVGAQGFLIAGINADDRAGYSVSIAGDVNGDGRADIVVGAPRSDPGAPARTNAGQVFVVFGKTDGGRVELSNLGTRGFRIEGAAADDRAGQTVSGAGDVNGDGLSDIVLGAHYADPPSRSGAGTCYVVFGKTNTNTVVLTGLGAQGFAIIGRSVNGLLGLGASGAGDVNGDGLSDVIVGAPFVSEPGRTNVGEVYVVFGKTSSAQVDVSTLGTAGFRIQAIDAEDRTGYALGSAGDVNGDGLADVIIGSRLADQGASQSVGEAHVVFGRSATGNVVLSNIGTGGDTNGFRIDGINSFDFAGCAVSGAGDVNGDGLADVIVGARYADPPGFGLGSAGQSYVVFGKTGGATVATSALGTQGFAINGAAFNDLSGESVSAAGDVNGDGLGDLVVGAFGVDAFGRAEAGATYVIFSPFAFPPQTTPATVTYREFVQPTNATFHGIGSLAPGNDISMFPASRLWIDFAGGTGSGLGGSSQVTVSRTRDVSTFGTFNPQTIANVAWTVSATRPGFGSYEVRVNYTDAEIAGLSEGALKMFSAPAPGGPYTEAASFSQNGLRNEYTMTANSLPRTFVLATAGPVPPLVGDANVDGVVNVADVTAIHNAVAGVAPLSPAGSNNLTSIGGTTPAAANAVVNHLLNGAPLP